MKKRIVHLSDLHVSGPDFVRELGENVIREVNSISPEIVIITGDLTNDGYPHEYEMAKRYIDMIECKSKLIVPGNHDARNVGYENFEETFGTRFPVLKQEDLIIVGIDSSEPDLDDGHIGRANYEFLRRHFSEEEKLEILALHHHLIPIPGTGRERNIPVDAGDVLKLLVDLKVEIVLSGHKHIPWKWRLEDTYFITAGTATTTRVKGKSVQSFNLIEIEDRRIEIIRISSKDGKRQSLFRIER